MRSRSLGERKNWYGAIPAVCADRLWQSSVTEADLRLSAENLRMNTESIHSTNSFRKCFDKNLIKKITKNAGLNLKSCIFYSDKPRKIDVN